MRDPFAITRRRRALRLSRNWPKRIRSLATTRLSAKVSNETVSQFLILQCQQFKDTKTCWDIHSIAFCFFTDKIRYLTMTDSTKVWMPDTFFRNEKVGRFHNILQPNLYVRVFPDGDVLYSIRVSLTCACSMHLALFPLDKQTCNLDVASCKCKFSAMPT